jgi:alanine dehydrogenase
VIVGIPKEVKDSEYRVAATPEGVHELVRAGQEVLVEDGAGAGSSIPQQRYERAGAEIVATAEEVWASSDMILKVKEPVPQEYGRLREGQILFTYLHLAASRELTQALIDRKVSAVAYETVQTGDGRLPLLAPMSEVAGRLATQMGAWALEKAQGGRGILLGGVPGVPPAKVVVLGGGIVGYNAALIAVGMQADVWVLDKSVQRMRDLEMMLDGRITLAMSNQLAIDEAVENADLVIGAVLIPGARAPKLITRGMLPGLKPGAALVDVAIDQGGCFETSHPTTHSDPVFVVDGIVH